MRKTCGAAILTALLVLSSAACGGSSGGRPSTGDLSAALQKETSKAGSSFGTVTKAQADCIAKVLHDSDVSDAALRAIKALDTTYKESKADDQAITAITPKLAKCGTG